MKKRMKWMKKSVKYDLAKSIKWKNEFLNLQRSTLTNKFCCVKKK